MSSEYTRSGDTLPMAVANMTFLVNRLGNDCAPLQFVRELTQNAIEGIEQAGDAEGQVVWDVEWNHFMLSDGVMKLCCIDTGAGMTGPEMVKHINQLSSSIHEQSASGNFGVGAKISAGPRNPHGLVYMSWKGGVGHMIHLWLDPEENVYGLKRWPHNNGEFWTPISSDLKPKQIQDHGTVVVLLGKSDEDNTIEAPVGTAMRSRWILRYLNQRYFRFPAGMKVQAREGWENPRDDKKHNFLRVVEGQGPWLDRNAESNGSVPLTDATAHWWILKESVDRDSGHNAGGGHIAALYQNELYEMSLRSSGGIAKLQMFGVIFGSDRVVIYVEPTTEGGQVTANTARTQLLIDNEAIDWSAWASGFRGLMPDEIRVLQEEIGSHSGDKSYKQKILDRLKDIRDILRFSRVRPSSNGVVPYDEDAKVTGGESNPSDIVRTGHREAGSKGGKSGDIYALFAETSEALGDQVETNDAPDVKWVKVADGSRVPPDLNDRAARFHLSQNLLMINADFRVFTDMVDRWVAAYAHVPGAETSVREVVHEWFEQQLTETVMSAKALKSTGRWSIDELSRLWNEESLTAAVLPRWHIDQSIRRNLGQRLGTLKAA
jgi:hypothetical protein